MRRISIASTAIISFSLGVVLVGCQSTSKSSAPAGSTPSTATSKSSTASSKPAKTAEEFMLSASKKLKLTKAELKNAQEKITKGTLSSDKGTLTFAEKDITLVVTSGPEKDMFSYRIQGVRNPTLKILRGAVVKVLVVNTGDDMVHDFVIGTLKRPISDNPSTTGTVGSDDLARERKEAYSAQQITFTAPQNGVTSYFCSEDGHARSGMWGTIVIGKVDSSQKIPSGHKAGQPHSLHA